MLCACELVVHVSLLICYVHVSQLTCCVHVSRWTCCVHVSDVLWACACDVLYAVCT